LKFGLSNIVGGVFSLTIHRMGVRIWEIDPSIVAWSGLDLYGIQWPCALDWLMAYNCVNVALFCRKRKPCLLHSSRLLHFYASRHCAVCAIESHCSTRCIYP